MKKTHRIKLPTPILKDLGDVISVMSDIREMTIERMTLFAEFEAATKAIDDAHRPAIDALGEQLQARTEQIKLWALENPGAFGDKRSIETMHGALGWRMGQWQCDKLAGWIWRVTQKTKEGAKVVVLALKRRFGGRYLRIKEEPDCDALIADRATLTAEQLNACGVRIFQDEAFYVDPKIEDTDNRQVAS